MRFYIQQHVFTWRDRFSIYDETERERYFVEGEVFSFGKKLHLLDLAGQELAYVHQEAFSFLPRYRISRDGADVAEVVRRFSFFRQEYEVAGLGWHVSGDFFAHEFEIRDLSGHLIAGVSKDWFSFGDAYAIDVDDYADEILALAIVIVIDAVISDDRA
ncbi:MAG: LURP-one-related family protein [Clostridia bacterium]|nr:LURP-one-related family protein [Clostridia bacterium]MBQ8331570.1 LURP-one-related family protein [Clostridia bacterium]